MGVGVRLFCVSYARISPVASIPPIIGIERSICAVAERLVYTRGQRLVTRTSMMSNCRFCDTRALNASTASDPFSTTSTVCPYFSRILTANFWFTRWSSATRMSNVSFVGAGLTVFNSKAGRSADARSWALAGVGTSEHTPLS